MYAEIENNICTNVVVANEEFADKMGFVFCEDGFGIGDIYENGAWSHPEPPEPIPPQPTLEERVTELEEQNEMISDVLDALLMGDVI